jgi:tetratricopeptide (TPR) repeat protein
VNRLIRSARALLSDLALGKLTPEESLRLLEEVEQDPRASVDLELRIALTELVASGDVAVFDERSVRAGGKDITRNRWWGLLTSHRPALAPAAVILVATLLVLGSIILREWERNPYDKIARIRTSDLDLRTREALPGDLSVASAMYAEGRFEEGARFLERYLRVNPTSPLRPFAHYAAALGYLVGARRAGLDLLPSYDTSMVHRAITHLDEAQGDVPLMVKEDIKWYRAKAYLMLEQPQAALSELDSIVDGAGLRSGNARLMKAEVDSIQMRGPR